MTGQPFLTTERLELWQPRASDLKAMHAIVLHPSTGRFLGSSAPLHEHATRFTRGAGARGGWGARDLGFPGGRGGRYGGGLRRWDGSRRPARVSRCRLRRKRGHDAFIAAALRRFPVGTCVAVERPPAHVCRRDADGKAGGDGQRGEPRTARCGRVCRRGAGGFARCCPAACNTGPCTVTVRFAARTRIIAVSRAMSSHTGVRTRPRPGKRFPLDARSAGSGIGLRRIGRLRHRLAHSRCHRRRGHRSNRRRHRLRGAAV